MAKIILTRGIQGSGKSTWAKNWVAEKPDTRMRINFDDLRNMMGPYNLQDWKPREKIIGEMFRTFMFAAMEKNYDIVVDNMNLSDSSVNRVIDIINKHNNEHQFHPGSKYTYEFKDFFIDVNVCIERDKMRANPIGERVIKQTWRQYRSKILLIENNKITESLTPADPKLPNCIIADMDSTICFNTSGRPFYGENAHEQMMDDVPNPGVINIIKSYLRTKSGDDKVFIITGREATKEIIQATLDYVDYHIGEHPDIHVLFRPEKEYMAGDLMKKKLLEDNILGKYNILYAIDDSKKVVNMYRQMGILTLQPVDGQF